MDDQVQRLVEKAWAKYQAAPPDQRLRKSKSELASLGESFTD